MTYTLQEPWTWRGLFTAVLGRESWVSLFVAGKLHKRIPAGGRGPIFLWKFEKQLQRIIYMATSPLRHPTLMQDSNKIGTPVCVDLYLNWMPGTECICVVSPVKDPDGLSHSRSLSFKAHDHGLALQAAFQHLFNLGPLSPPFFSSWIESGRFASLCLSLRQWGEWQ